MMTFSQRTMRHLVSFMHQKNISQRDLAAALDVTEARVSQMFRVGSNLTLKSVDEIEEALIKILNSRPLGNFVFLDTNKSLASDK